MGAPTNNFQNEVTKAQLEMNEAILKSVAAEAERFKAKTGISPESFTVDMMETTSINDAWRQYRPVSVRSWLSTESIVGPVLLGRYRPD